MRERTKSKTNESKKKKLEQKHKSTNNNEAKPTNNNTKIKRNKRRKTNKKARTKARTRARAHQPTAKENKTRIGHIYGDMKVGDRAKTRTKQCKQQIWTNTSRQAQNKGAGWEQAYIRARAKAKKATQKEHIENGK